MTDDTHTQDAGRSTRDMEERFPRALWVRLFVYIAVGHVLAAFIYLLFEVGAK